MNTELLEIRTKKPAIFIHIQKTAGTSMVDVAKQHYQQNIISHGDYLKGVYHSPFKKDFWIDEQVMGSFHRTPFLSGHFGYDFAKLFMDGRYTFTFLRDPIERVLSFYYFCKTRDPNEFETYRLCQQFSLDEFLKMGLEQPEIGFFIWNNQVWQLACGFGNLENRNLSSFESAELLDLAIKHLENFSYVGLTETFEQDRDRILTDLGIALPEEKIISNATPRPTSKDLPQPTLELLEQLTYLDQILYQSVASQRNSELKAIGS
ncbi:MAG: sulfotransferase family 2 domain-containing protein [Nitrosospira multiformis]|nr:sulfotransferase family 2 domain-containing protein [Nitrosospira multiformis]